MFCKQYSLLGPIQSELATLRLSRPFIPVLADRDLAQTGLTSSDQFRPVPSLPAIPLPQSPDWSVQRGEAATSWNRLRPPGGGQGARQSGGGTGEGAGLMVPTRKPKPVVEGTCGWDQESVWKMVARAVPRWAGLSGEIDGRGQRGPLGSEQDSRFRAGTWMRGRS